MIFHRPHNDPEYRKADAWAKAYHPYIGGPYRPVWEYATRKHSLLLASWTVLDRKADDVTRYATLLIGAMGTIGGLVTSRTWHVVLIAPPWAILVPFVLIIGGFIAAVIARLPVTGSSGAPITELAKRIEEDEDADEATVQGWMSASLHVVITALRLSLERKAALVTGAILALFVGAAMFSLILWFGIQRVQ